ncbi:MAG: hypothetical protein ACPGXZ_12430 [Saprospiraceae bacterium]
MDKRPNLDKNISIKDFQEFYWLKEELVIFCRKEGLRTGGSKIEITERISYFLKTREKKPPILKTKIKTTSKFDWNNAKLSLETVITDNL